MRALAAAALLLAACGKKPADDAAVRVADCEHLLSHLVVLERGADARPVSAFEADRAAFVAACPKAVSPEQLDCWLRATTLEAADACRPRAELAAALGKAPAAAPTDAGTLAATGAGTSTTAPLAADAGAAPATDAGGKRATDWNQLLDGYGALRERMCACKDLDCAQKVDRDLEAFIEESLLHAGAPPDDVAEKGGALEEALRACRRKLGPDEPPSNIKEPQLPLVLETGVPECDELVERQIACAEKMGMAADLHDAHRDMIEAYREGGKDPAQRPKVIEACKDAMKQAQASWDAAGC